MKRLHQFIIGATPGDAITDHAFLIQRWLREDGWVSEIYAESIHPSLSGKVQPYCEYRPARSGEWVILHHSIGSDLVEDLLQKNLCFLLIYHNITPPSFFQPVDPALVAQMQKGRKQLELLRAQTLLALGVSSFNEAELRAAGFARTGILPIALDPLQYDLEPNPDLMNCYRNEGPRLLFVGRLVPNKKQEDLLKLLYFYQRIEPSARLFLVGPPWVPAYAEWLRELAEELGLGEAVVFTGHVSQRDLVTYYRLADVYVSMSEHEGFGKPLIEAMYLGVPVIAYTAGGVPETMGGAGVLFRVKDWEALAELVDIVVKSEPLRKRIVERQRERASQFLEPSVRRTFEQFIANILEGDDG